MKKIVLILMFVFGMSADFFTTIYPMDGNLEEIIEDVLEDSDFEDGEADSGDDGETTDSGDDGEEASSEDGGEGPNLPSFDDLTLSDDEDIEYDTEAYARLLLGEKNMRNKNLIGANLSNIDLTDVDFSGASLMRAIFSGNKCILRTKFDRADLTDAKFDKTRILDTSFVESDLTRTNFSGARIIKTKFSKNTMNKTNFREATLTLVTIECITTQIANPDFTKATLEFSKLKGIYLKGAILRQIKICGRFGMPMIIEKCKFEQTDFTQADLEVVSVIKTSIRGEHPELSKSAKTGMGSMAGFGASVVGAFIFPPAGFAGMAASIVGFCGAAAIDEHKEKDAKENICTGLRTITNASGCHFYEIRDLHNEKDYLRSKGATFHDKWEDEWKPFLSEHGSDVAGSLGKAGVSGLKAATPFIAAEAGARFMSHRAKSRGFSDERAKSYEAATRKFVLGSFAKRQRFSDD